MSDAGLHEEIERLSAVYRELDEEQRRRVKAHVQVCPACARRLATFQAVDRQLKTLNVHDEERLQTVQPDRAAFRARAEADERPASRLRGLFAALDRPLAVAGALVGLILLLAIGGLFATWFASLQQPGPGVPVETARPLAALPSPPQITCMETGEVVDVLPEFELLSRREVAAQAEAIIVGTVTGITCDGWNQDGGEYWEVEVDEALPREEVTVLNGAEIPPELVTEDGRIKVVAGASASIVHQVTLQVEEVLLDEVGLGEEAVLTVFGNSPTGRAGPEHDLQVGQRVLVYAQRQELPWRDPDRPPQVELNQNGAFLNVGRRQLLSFAAGYPPLAFLRQTADGLFAPQPPSPDVGVGPASLEQMVEELAAQRAAEGLPPAGESAQVRDLGRLAYVQDGDIWVKALPGGPARPVTEGGQNWAPLWSPSGQWLAFVKDDVLWVLDANAPEEAYSLQTTASGGFAWSPTGDRLAFTAGAELKLLEAGRGAIADLVSLPGDGEEMYRITHPFWKPDGTAIAYEQYRLPADPSDALQREHGIWLLELDGGEPTHFFDSNIPEKGEAILAGWSGDGQYILFWQSPILSASILMDGVPLYSLRLDGGEPIMLGGQGAEGFGLPVLAHRDFIASMPQASQAVAQSAAGIAAGGGRQTWQSKRLGIADLETGGFSWTTPEDAVALSPAWSPDGRSLAYVSAPDAGNLAGGDPAREAMFQRHIEVADLAWLAEGNDATPPPARRLTDDPAYRDERPLWSAGGSHILFARIDRDEQASLWLIPTEGGQAEKVVESLSPPPPDTGWFGAYGYLDWSQYYDWWRGPLRPQPQATATPPSAATRAPVTATPAPATEPPLTEGATVTGRIVQGYGDHVPVGDLPLWIGKTSEGEPDARTDDEGRFTLTGLPPGLVPVANSHLAFQVPVSATADVVDLGLLNYPLVHPPPYYGWAMQPLPSLEALLEEGDEVPFSICQADPAWERPSVTAQRAQVWSQPPFSFRDPTELEAWFRLPAVMYDTVDLFPQSFPDGPELDALASDRRYLLGLWTAEDLSQSNCSYEGDALNDILARRQIEVWLMGYRATGIRHLSGEPDPDSVAEGAAPPNAADHYAVQVTAAPGFQIIRFPGNEGIVAVHVSEGERELNELPTNPFIPGLSPPATPPPTPASETNR